MIKGLANRPCFCALGRLHLRLRMTASISRLSGLSAAGIESFCLRMEARSLKKFGSCSPPGRVSPAGDSLPQTHAGTFRYSTQIDSLHTKRPAKNFYEPCCVRRMETLSAHIPAGASLSRLYAEPLIYTEAHPEPPVC